MVTKSPATIEQLRALPDDGRDHEIAAGELRRLPLPILRQGRIGTTVVLELGTHVRSRHLGDMFMEMHCILSRDPLQVRVPDVAFVRADRLPTDEESEDYVDGAPDLAVEIVSPSQTFHETQEKALLYLAAGSRLVWVVEPRGRTVTVYTPDRRAWVIGEDDVLDGGDVIPDLALPVRRLFE